MKYGTVTLLLWLAFGLSFYSVGLYGPNHTLLLVVTSAFGGAASWRHGRMHDALEREKDELRRANPAVMRGE